MQTEPKKMPAHVRIENDTMMGNHTVVVFVDKDGNETDISSVVKDATFHLAVGEVNTATLELIKVVGSVRADLTAVAVQDLRPRRGWRRLRDVTTFNRHGLREYA